VRRFIISHVATAIAAPIAEPKKKIIMGDENETNCAITSSDFSMQQK